MIRVAILGAGIGREHLAAYRALGDRFGVAMIVDLDPTRAEALRLPGESFVVESDLQAALSADLDLIDICLPPHLHVPTALAALAAGKHVVCEKPLATRLSDCARLEEGSRAAGRSLFPVFQYRWGPSCAQLRHVMAQGLAGRPLVASLETHWNRGAEYYAVPWRGTWAGEQGGAVLGHAIHNHDLLTHFLGPVAEVSAFADTRVNPIETEDCAAIALRMASGALVTSSITLGAGFDRTRLRFVFEDLTVTSGDAPYAPGAEPWRFTARDPARQAALDAALAETPHEPAGFEGFFAEIARALADETHAAVMLEDGIASVGLVTAIYHAARTGTRVALPLGSDHPLHDGWQPK
jgi:predicted dehydrogenase